MSDVTRALATMTPAAEAIRAHGRPLPERRVPPRTLAETLFAAAAVGDRFDLAMTWSGTENDRILASAITDQQIEHGVMLRGAGLGTTDPKIASNMWLQWYCYRMAAPVMASWVMHRRIPDASAANIAFRFDGEGRPVFAAMLEPRASALPGDCADDARLTHTPDLLTEIVRVLLQEHLLPLADRVRTRYRLGATLVRGTVASQIGMSLTAVDGHSTVPWEQVATDTMDVMEFTKALIDGQGRSGDVSCIACHGRVGMTFRRGTCCTVYRIPGREMCGGCPLRSDEERAGVYADRLAARPDWALT